jgi:hypothetical protein
MKKKITICMLFGLFVTINLSAQNEFGPGEFETFEYNFSDGSTEGWSPAWSANEFILEENPFTGNNELRWVDRTFANVYYNNRGWGFIYMDATFENYELSFRAFSGFDNTTGMIFNWQDSLNFNTFYYNIQNQRWALFERKDGPDSLDLQNWDNHALLDGYVDPAVLGIDTIQRNFRYRVRNHEGKTSIWINDIHVLNSVPMPEFTSGKIGIYGLWRNNPNYWDSIRVESTFNMLSCEATLSEITASAGDFWPEEFHPAVREYYLTVPGPATEVTLTAVPSHASATVAGDGVISVPGTHEIIVTAEDGTEYSYTVITQEGEPTNIPELSEGNSQPRVYAANGTLYVRGSEPVRMEIYNMLGSRVKSVHDALQVSLDDLNNGIYIVRIIGDSQAVKIIK